MSVKDVEEDVEKGAMDKTEKEGSVKKEEESGEKKEGNEKESDVVFVQDVGFTVKIHAPNLEPFDVQVGSITL